MTTRAFIHPTAGQIVLGANKSSSRRVPPPAGIPPGVAGTIPNQVVTQGSGNVFINAAAYFTGTGLTYALQSAITGVSLAAGVLTISDTTVLAPTTVTVVASNAFGPNATQSFSREVKAPAAGGTVTITPFVRDDIVFDLGTSVGDPEVWVPISGTAGPGEPVQARGVSLDDFGITTTPWVDIATANGVGDYAGVLKFVSLSNSRFRPEVRLKNAPATTAQGTRTFCVGHVAMDIGQSERFRVRASFYTQNTPSEAIIDVGDAVKQLAAPYRVGRVKPTSAQPFTVGVDALPTGLTKSGNTITVNPSTYDGAPFDNWYCPDCRIDIGDKRFVMRNTTVEIVSDLSIPYSINMLNGGGFKLIRDCTFIAKPGGLAFSAWLKEESAGSGTNLVLPDMGWFYRNYLTGTVADGLKVGRGYYVENLLEWTWNIPGQPGAWAAGTTYAQGDFVKFNNNFFKSKSSGNTGNQPPSNQTDNTFWQSWNPHSDALNPQHGVDGFLYYARNYVRADSARAAGNTLDGINNILFRMVRDPSYQAANNKIDKILIEENVIERDTGIASYAVQLEGGTNVTAPTLRGNRIRPTTSGNEGFMHPSGVTAGTEWTDNRRLTDNSVIDTSLWPNASAGTYTPSPEKAVQFASHDDAVINAIAYLNSGHRPTAGLTAMANGLISEFPGRRFALGASTKSGTSLSQLMNDGSTTRQLPHYIAFKDYLCPHGSQPGTITMFWQAADQGLGANFADNILPMLTGKYLIGSPVVLPANLGQRTVQHTMDEVHGPFTRTRILLCGPGARGPEEDMVNADYSVAVQNNGIHRQDSMTNYQKIRQEYRDMVVAVGGQNIIVPFVGIQPLAHYAALADGVHPSDHVDGLPTMGRYIAIESMQGLGLLPDFKVEFDQSFFAANGTYAEFWSSRGPITTGRKKRGLSAIPATYPHRTEVFAWEIGDTLNGAVPVQSATVVNGRVRVLPISGAFVNGQKFAFGRGGCTGIIQAAADSADRYDLQYPLVDLGFYKLDGHPVEPMPSSLVLTASGIT